MEHSIDVRNYAVFIYTMQIIFNLESLTARSYNLIQARQIQGGLQRAIQDSTKGGLQ